MPDFTRNICIVLAVMGAIFSYQKGIAQQSLTDIPKDERNALDLVMTFGEDERIAKESDLAERHLSNLKSVHGDEFMPYYAEGDFDDDGDEDFAIVHIQMGGVRDKDEEAQWSMDKWDDWGVTISVFEANEDYARGFDPAERVRWGGEKDKTINLLSRLFIQYDEYLYFCIIDLKCERAISVGDSYAWEKYEPN